ARAVSLDTDNYINSWTRSRTYLPLANDFSGNLAPTWTNVTGGENLEYQVTVVSSQETSLAHGDTTIFIGGEEQEAGTANSLSFEAKSFDSSLDQSFSMGELSFYNGSTFNQSDADSATLSIDLSLSEPTTLQQTITIPLALVSTPNSDDSYDSADAINMSKQSFNLSQSIEGVNYRLRIEFGPAQDGGFGTGSSISAFEGAQVKAEIYGTFEAR
ncbi:MAG: choice-of-anchor K domain-containing protein, partial [Verrucomicrobiota bacterium]